MIIPWGCVLYLVLAYVFVEICNFVGSLSLYQICYWFLLALLLNPSAFVNVCLFTHFSIIYIPTCLFILRPSVHHSNISIHQVLGLVALSYLLFFWICWIIGRVILNYSGINWLYSFVSLSVFPGNVLFLLFLFLLFVLVSDVFLSFLSLTYKLIIVIVTVWTGNLRLLLLYKAWALNCVNKEIFVGDCPFTFLTLFRPGLTLF